MVILSPVDDPATSHPLAAADAAAGASSQPPPAGNPEPSLFDSLGGTEPYAAAGTSTAWSWSSHPPPYASTANAYGGGVPNSSSSPMLSGFMTDTFSLQQAMAEPLSYWHPQTQLGFQPWLAPAAPSAQGAMPPPVLRPMVTTRVEASYSYHPQTQGAAVSAAGGGGEAAIVHAVPDAQKQAAQEATAPAPRRRGRPRKDAAAPAKPKPAAFKPPNKRATARGKRAASRPTASVAGSAATMAGQVQVQVQQPDQQAANVANVQVQQPDHQAASRVVALANSNQPGSCTNLMALLCQDDIQEQWQLQVEPTCSNSLIERDQHQAAAAVRCWQQEVIVPYGPYADTSVAGVRFQPTDHELIYYLRLKHAGREMPVEFFKEFDVYQATPATSRAVCGEVDGFWYAFSPRFRKYKNGERPARSVLEAPGGRQVGYWKSNTKVVPVLAGGNKDGALIGNVTSLTFHLGRQPKGTQTPWKMKEYAIPENQHAPDGSAMRLNDWVVCKLFYKERVIKNGVVVEEDQLGEAASDENDGWAEGDEATFMVPDVQTLVGNSEQDLCVEDYLGYGQTFAHL
ncbi:unnamed protein product [Urochloa decumbens]|uniref:NAC domain-containing protein n=1 Tax=Urochloa decumbens TaxID=240449 RepID=A0ABC8X6W5_9POAL